MAQKRFLLVLGILGFARVGSAQLVQTGQCETIIPMQNFDVDAFLGAWYDFAHYPTADQNGTCSRVELVNETGNITIRNMMVDDGQLKEQTGVARLSSIGQGVLTVTFELENGEESVAQEYFILGTDYNSYALVYSCRNLEEGTRQVLSWKLSRSPTLTVEAEAAINTIINNTESLLEEHYQPQSHSDQDCFYVPELVPGQPVLLPGGCNWMPSMEGIDFRRYLGWWHEVERYPGEELRGQCSSIEFTPDSLFPILYYLDVTEIDIHEGVANETTCSAILFTDSTIIIYGHPFRTLREWVILDTDYDTYSLIYSCEPLNTPWGPYRRVWSAKHSKQRSLTAEAQNAMNPFIEAHPDLHPHLYESVDQSDSACFYYRETIGEQVILPGQCDTNIPVQANFNVSQFAGTWYQLERYPTPQVSSRSTCIGTQYTVNDDGVTLQNWEIVDGVFNTTFGNATVDGASLTVTLAVEGGNETETTILQILTTDYENYALVYTCVNINDFQRTIGAFILSRSREMSDIGLSSIEDYMATREEFHRPYFISVMQEDDCEEPSTSAALLVKSSILVMLFCVTLQLVMYEAS